MHLTTRRSFLKTAGICASSGLGVKAMTESKSASRPNILIAISDDQSYSGGSISERNCRTPNFDKVARAGVFFSNAYCAAPSCSPSRAALLTGRHCWQLEEAGTHASSFPVNYKVYPDILEEAGYLTGFVGKGWSPGNWRISGRSRNPAGRKYAGRPISVPEGISKEDYFDGFQTFLADRKNDQPFCFWFGCEEPHRIYSPGIGLKSGKNLADVRVPSFLPDTDAVRSDILDYYFEIEHFDSCLGRMLDHLESIGELDNTIVILTSDNGMPFPRAKANLYEYGTHIPLAISWKNGIPSGRTLTDLVGFVDIAPTILEAAGISRANLEYPMSGKSLLSMLKSSKTGSADPTRTAVYASRERHSSSRTNNLGYPSRSIRKDKYLYIMNLAPERWPAGDPREMQPSGKLGPVDGAYYDIDAGVTKQYLIDNKNDPVIGRYFHLAIDKRPFEELFDVSIDPGCLTNLAQDPAAREVKALLRANLEAYLRQTGDPAINRSDIFESYPRHSGELRNFPAPSSEKETTQGETFQPRNAR